ncbi:hypothetical protein HanRHA438_Chr17g0831041 [Helianthus annuus]|uniref:Secreted protein n=1 Tax=Helianthus annuus TaxID=4232 RepID=A0A9K3DJY8_HELAN|nr:hypothetical protein HanXRQr2_Chr17g0821121 [Helianthus annuus]KAJ0430410.1 hypothetical protein HanHA300_Chr17g0668701 [Helianthus annuus]KAJ0448826.1 hypothetical protein HanHA89_Chr17g0721471 [Helianthus annuus]KAJ0633705.1 hypothetical protein HanLR1_Chr17g0679901 [Helianthus annuus]KAJ0637518.1 hypothetical protein HanOQP8_Chr17g0674831 [Helianthus annuus]
MFNHILGSLVLVVLWLDMELKIQMIEALEWRLLWSKRSTEHLSLLDFGCYQLGPFLRCARIHTHTNWVHLGTDLLHPITTQGIQAQVLKG